MGICSATIGILAFSVLPCAAGDVAVLRNGFSIRHERRQVMGTVTRLFIDGNDSSFVDIPTAEIDHFEAAPVETPSVAAEPAASTSIAKPAPADAAASRQKPQSSSVQAAGLNVQHPLDLNEVVKSASGTYSLDPDLVSSVIRAESGFNAHAVSPKGAQGLMQLMPQTANGLGVQNAFDPQANVDGGTRYLRELLERYNFDLIKALAAYNAGPERVEHYNGVPPYNETKAYVARIVRDFNKKKLAAQAAEKAKAKAEAQAAAKAQQKGTATATAKSGGSPQVTKTHNSAQQAQAKPNPSQTTQPD